jgi:16S rRNA (cytosine1402-N4)-methyltransferase
MQAQRKSRPSFSKIALGAADHGYSPALESDYEGAPCYATPYATIAHAANYPELSHPVLAENVNCDHAYKESRKETPIMRSSETPEHFSVMLPEVIEALAPQEGGRYLDCTFGRGGYSRALLTTNQSLEVFAVDRDETAVDAAKEVVAEFGGRFQFFQACFDDLQAVFKNHEKFDGIVWDLGVSSPQLDKAERGFSFRFDGPLDMRMGLSSVTAAEVVNTYAQDDLANLIYRYGEEKKSRAIARAIVADRQAQPFETTAQLAELVRRIVPKSRDGIDPSTRTFQALRIYVNDELGQLERSLEQALSLVKPGGRLVVVTFHSLEDRIVKHFIRERSRAPHVNRYVPLTDEAKPVLQEVTKKPIQASNEELQVNPRSRSAKLRAAIYLPEGPRL